MQTTTNPIIAAVADASGEMLALELTDAQITEIARVAYAEGRLSWLGFQKDGDGRYTVPVLSQGDYQLVRAVLAAMSGAAPKQASEQGGWQPLPEGRPTDDMVKAGMKRMFDEKRYSAPWDDVIALMFMDMVKAAQKSPSPHPEEGALLLGDDESGKAMGGAA